MSRPPRVAVLQPRLDGHGGAEKYAVHLMQALSGLAEIDAVTEHPVDRHRLHHAFGVSLEGVRFLCDPRVEPRVRPSSRWQEALRRRAAARAYAELTRPYDLVVGVTIRAPWRSRARRSLLLCHFPVVSTQRVDAGVRPTGWRSLVDARGREQRDLRARLESWTALMCNSEFTRRHIRRYWARDARVVNPPIDLPPPPDLSEKRRWIAGAAYFSRPPEDGSDPLSYKRQEVLIDAFKELCDQGLTGWELHLAGHVLPPDPPTFAYVEALSERAAGYPVTLHPDCAHEELLEIYRRASLFWHATGYGVDQDRYPEKTEHFGMVVAEAMGWGCVPMIVNRGGQPEIIEDGRSGLVWETVSELREHTRLLARDRDRLSRMAEAAVQRAQRFGLPRFRRQIVGLYRELLNGDAANVQMPDSAAPFPS